MLQRSTKQCRICGTSRGYDMARRRTLDRKMTSAIAELRDLQRLEAAQHASLAARHLVLARSDVRDRNEALANDFDAWGETCLSRLDPAHLASWQLHVARRLAEIGQAETEAVVAAETHDLASAKHARHAASTDVAGKLRDVAAKRWRHSIDERRMSDAADIAAARSIS